MMTKKHQLSLRKFSSKKNDIRFLASINTKWRKSSPEFSRPT